MTDAKFWDGVAEKYAKSPIGDMDAYEATLTRVRSYLRPTDAVLEIGCGTGTTALKLAPFAGRYLASDISTAMIGIGRDKAAAEGVRNLGFATAPAETPPEGSFDAVLSFNLLHLVDD
ncbi:MAG: class I SAM-dependent methyltransferase, partial [Paracoccaceae bacterium]